MKAGKKGRREQYELAERHVSFQIEEEGIASPEKQNMDKELKDNEKGKDDSKEKATYVEKN